MSMFLTILTFVSGGSVGFLIATYFFGMKGNDERQVCELCGAFDHLRWPK